MAKDLLKKSDIGVTKTGFYRSLQNKKTVFIVVWKFKTIIYCTLESTIILDNKKI
jgi:hypothetical protein